MIADKFSLIRWNSNLTEAPTREDVLIIYKDDTWDYIEYRTLVAWKINDDIWVSNDDQIYSNNIICWSYFPKYENIKVF